LYFSAYSALLASLGARVIEHSIKPLSKKIQADTGMGFSNKAALVTGEAKGIAR
jgi:hypothetical protein